MSVTKYGAATTILTINARKMSDFSNDDEPIQISRIDPKRELDMHHGGGSLLVERVNEGGQLTISCQPGTADSAFLSGLYSSGDEVESQLLVKGTGELIILSGGFVVDFGNVGRGFRPSNDNYILQFTKIIKKMGNA